MKPEFLTVQDLKDILKHIDGDIPVIITREGKDHSYGVTREDIKFVHDPYFPDGEVANYFQSYHVFINIGNC